MSDMVYLSVIFVSGKVHLVSSELQRFVHVAHNCLCIRQTEVQTKRSRGSRRGGGDSLWRCGVTQVDDKTLDEDRLYAVQSMVRHVTVSERPPDIQSIHLYNWIESIQSRLWESPFGVRSMCKPVQDPSDLLTMVETSI